MFAPSRATSETTKDIHVHLQTRVRRLGELEGSSTVTVRLRSNANPEIQQPLRQDTLAACPGGTAAGPPSGSGSHTLHCPDQ